MCFSVIVIIIVGCDTTPTRKISISSDTLLHFLYKCHDNTFLSLLLCRWHAHRRSELNEINNINWLINKLLRNIDKCKKRNMWDVKFHVVFLRYIFFDPWWDTFYLIQMSLIAEPGTGGGIVLVQVVQFIRQRCQRFNTCDATSENTTWNICWKMLFRLNYSVMWVWRAGRYYTINKLTFHVKRESLYLFLLDKFLTSVLYRPGPSNHE